jgi:hypothetical protein
VNPPQGQTVFPKSTAPSVNGFKSIDMLSALR